MPAETRWWKKMFGSSTVYLPLEDYLTGEHGRNKQWRRLETELEQAGRKTRNSYWKQLSAVWPEEMKTARREKLLDVAVAVTHTEFLDAALDSSLSQLSYQTRETWWAAVSKAIKDLPEQLKDEVTDAGLDLEVLAGYICRDRQLFGFGGDTRAIRSVIADALTAGVPMTEFDDPEHVNQLVNVKGHQQRDADAASQVPDALRKLIKIRLALDKSDEAAGDPFQLLETALKTIRSERYMLKPYQGGGLDWQEISRDWRNYQHYRQQIADGIPEALRSGYSPDSSAISQLSRALDLPEQRIVELIEQIAVEAPEKSPV